MKIREILTEGLKRDKAIKIINSFVKFAANELNLDELPNINIQDDNSHSIEQFFGPMFMRVKPSKDKN